MKTILSAASALALVAGGAGAAGLDRSGQSVLSVFAPDGTTNLSFGVIMPELTGKDIDGGGDYEVGETYLLPSLSYTNDLGNGFSYSVLYDQPYGADIDYNGDPATTGLGGTLADLDSQALTLTGRYAINDRFSVFGGVSIQRINAEVNLNGNAYANAISVAATAQQFNAGLPTGAPALSSTTLSRALQQDPDAIAEIDGTYGSGTFGNGLVPGFTTARGGFVANDGYKFEMENSTRPNYFIGAAYEIPDIRFRFAMTYRFETEHEADTTERFFGVTTDGDITFVTPQSLNLEFQTGIAQGTLLTASYRWTEFSAVDLVPDALQSDLVNLEDAERYTLGVARVFSDTLAGSVTLLYEPETGGETVSPLGPTDGLFGITLGGRYTDGPLNISGGVNYSWLGDADAGVAGQPVAEFRDSTSLAVGIQANILF